MAVDPPRPSRRTAKLDPSKLKCTAAPGAHSSLGINGFSDIVTFNVTGGGKFVKKFTFGTLGCFGIGSFPVGTDPYGDPTNTGVIASIPVTKGAFKYTTKLKLPESEGTVTTALVQGSFTSSRAVSGTITISQSDNGDTCGPSKMKFTAVPGTPTSLGLE